MLSSLADKLRRSWLLTRITLRIIFRQDRELLFFPLFQWLAVMATMVTSTMVVTRTQSIIDVKMTGDPGVTILVILVLLLTTALFSMCATHTTRVRLEGGDASLLQSLGFGLRRLHIALAWTACYLAASSLLSTVRKSTREAGFIARIVLRPITWMLETAWAVAKLMVVPAMVYEGHGPIAGMRASVEAVKRTWGEALTRHLGFRAISSLLYFIGILVGISVMFQLPADSTIQHIAIHATIGYVTAVFVLFHLVNTVFNTALYHYATRGEAGMGFSEEILRGAVRRKDS